MVDPGVFGQIEELVIDDGPTVVTAAQNVRLEPGGPLLVDGVEFATVSLPVALVAQGIQLRIDGLNEEHVELLRNAPDRLPPIVIHRATMTVVDGAHRLAVARARGQDRVEAVLLDGAFLDAYLLALRLNSRHGLPLSRKDRRAAVERLLSLSPSWSDRRIAAAAGVSPKTVAAARSRSTEEIPQPNARVGRDGRERPVQVIAGRARAAELLSAQPSATLRQVAATSGVSVSTVHDVRRRMNDGTKPVSRELTGNCDQSSRAAKPRELPPTGLPGSAHLSPGAGLSSFLHALRADPSIRATSAGRTLLRALSAHDEAFAGDDQLAPAVPAHRREMIAGLARRCGEAWLSFARQIDHSPGSET